MLHLFATPEPVLPEWLLTTNLLALFLWYILILFLLSIALRIRFYRSVVDIAQHVKSFCPRIFNLISEHWILCTRNGLLVWAGAYVGVFIPYYILNRFVWPSVNVTFLDLAAVHHGLLTIELVLVGLMVTLDFVLILQVSVIDTERIKSDLTWSEDWLSGRLFRVLETLGRWNPIKIYAGAMTAESMIWLNKIFRYGLWSMILQLSLRLAVAGILYGVHVAQIQA